MTARLLIIADDLTGALDTGVKFSQRGISSYVSPHFKNRLSDLKTDARVLILDTESRHLPPDEAYARIFELAREARSLEIPHIYKKTDSALRGNIGAELSALLDASQVKLLPFLPAYPLMNRVTKDGYHFIDGTPVAESPFGLDPFEPVKDSYIPDILASQCDTRIQICRSGTIPDPDGFPSIVVFDAEADRDLRISGELLGGSSLKISAGCAGFAGILPDLLGMEPEILPEPEIYAATLYVCGSVNPITMEQIEAARSLGFPVFEPDSGIISSGFSRSESGKQLVSQVVSALKDKKKAVLASAYRPETLEKRRAACEATGLSLEELRVNIARNLADLAHTAASEAGKLNLVVFGGDTLGEMIRVFGAGGLTPVRELIPGVVLAGADGGLTMITKSGGFGASDTVPKIDDYLSKCASGGLGVFLKKYP